MRIITLLCSFMALGWAAAGAELQFNFGDLAAGSSLGKFHAALLGGGGPVAWKILQDEVPSALAPLKGTAPNTIISHRASGEAITAMTSSVASRAARLPQRHHERRRASGVSPPV